MNAPWFPEQYAWVFGASIGVLGGIVGTLVGCLAPFGKARTLVYAVYWFALIASVTSLITGLSALISGQPYAIWYGLTLAGIIGSLVIGLNYFTLANAYRHAEARKMAAQNL
jgi:hypothetical protein